MGPTGLPEKVLLKQKFKITLSSWVSNTWLSVRLSVRFSYPRVSNLLGPRSSNVGMSVFSSMIIRRPQPLQPRRPYYANPS